MLTRKFVISAIIEFGPISAFFIGTELANFFVGTTLLVLGTTTALTFSLILDGAVPIFSIVSSAFVFLFGGLTLLLRDPFWLVVEYTLYNIGFGAAILFGLLQGKALLKPLFSRMFHISDHAWRILSMRWAFFFILTAMLNQIVWQYYGETVWVYFRVFAGVGLAVFGFSQFFLARKHREEGSSPWGLRI